MSDRDTYLQLYKEGPFRLRQLLASIPEEAMIYQPGPDRWSIQEIAIHAVDADLNGYLRFRKTVAEPGATIPVYDETVWGLRLDYMNTDLDTALNLMDTYRKYLLDFLNKRKEEDWDKYVIHPEVGKMTLDIVLKTYALHLFGHIKHIERTFNAWKRFQIGQTIDISKSFWEPITDKDIVI
ncbi:DinB family protein [Spirochaeta cellobiosiphila]|uniref:DinB family protein n=1 Tax=Spirochaeta cellobiosiphila TaxID=504483 RepID=UPI000429F656|nr:DinB family protein [Spirochaeta cellobiosiphila]